MTENWKIKRVKALWNGRVESKIAVATKYYEFHEEKLSSDCDWRIFILAPIEGVSLETIMKETNKFLTYEEGYQLGVIIEGDWADGTPPTPKQYLSRSIAPRLVNEIIHYVSQGLFPSFSP